jgi:hypothetical protein
MAPYRVVTCYSTIHADAACLRGSSHRYTIVTIRQQSNYHKVTSELHLGRFVVSPADTARGPLALPSDSPCDTAANMRAVWRRRNAQVLPQQLASTIHAVGLPCCVDQLKSAPGLGKWVLSKDSFSVAKEHFPGEAYGVFAGVVSHRRRDGRGAAGGRGHGAAASRSGGG